MVLLFSQFAFARVFKANIYKEEIWDLGLGNFWEVYEEFDRFWVIESWWK